MGFFSGITSFFYGNNSALQQNQAAARSEQEGIQDWIPLEPGASKQNNEPQQTPTSLTTAVATNSSASAVLASTRELTFSLNAHVLPPEAATGSATATAARGVLLERSAANTERAAVSHVFHLPIPVEGHVPAKMSLSQRISGIFNSCVDSLKRGKNRTVEIISNNKDTVIATTVAVVAVACFIATWYILTNEGKEIYQRGYQKGYTDGRDSVIVAKSIFWKWWPF